MMSIATLSTTPNAVVDNHVVDKEYLACRGSRQATVDATIRGRGQATRRLDAQRKALWHDNYAYEVAPKWTRHAEDYVNPHLLEHERDPIAPRYGADAVPSRLMPTGTDHCRCSWCVAPHATKKATFRRETQAALKNVVSGPTGIRKGPWADWDWEGENDPYARDRGNDWGFDEPTKPAPVAELDLLAMAKPAKVKRRTVAHQKRALTYESLAGPSMRDVDDVSMLDYEETWEHLEPEQLDRLLRGLDNNDATSEWDWDKCSQA